MTLAVLYQVLDFSCMGNVRNELGALWDKAEEVLLDAGYTEEVIDRLIDVLCSFKPPEDHPLIREATLDSLSLREAQIVCAGMHHLTWEDEPSPIVDILLTLIERGKLRLVPNHVRFLTNGYDLNEYDDEFDIRIVWVDPEKDPEFFTALGDRAQTWADVEFILNGHPISWTTAEGKEVAKVCVDVMPLAQWAVQCWTGFFWGDPESIQGLLLSREGMSYPDLHIRDLRLSGGPTTSLQGNYRLNRSELRDTLQRVVEESLRRCKDFRRGALEKEWAQLSCFENGLPPIPIPVPLEDRIRHSKKLFLHGEIALAPRQYESRGGDPLALEAMLKSGVVSIGGDGVYRLRKG